MISRSNYSDPKYIVIYFNMDVRGGGIHPRTYTFDLTPNKTMDFTKVSRSSNCASN